MKPSSGTLKVAARLGITPGPDESDETLRRRIRAAYDHAFESRYLTMREVDGIVMATVGHRVSRWSADGQMGEIVVELRPSLWQRLMLRLYRDGDVLALMVDEALRPKLPIGSTLEVRWR